VVVVRWAGLFPVLFGWRLPPTKGGDRWGVSDGRAFLAFQLSWVPQKLGLVVLFWREVRRSWAAHTGREALAVVLRDLP